jgi:multiple sugar transport system permease protein
VFLAFMVGPVAASLGMSFTDLRSSDLRNPFAVEFAGIDNYAALLEDETFLQAARNTAYFVLVGVPLTMALALAAAVGLNSGIRRFRTFFRVGYYLPVVTSIVAVAVVWRLLLDDRRPGQQPPSALVGIDGPNWLSDHLGHALAHHDGGLAKPRLPDGHLPRRAPGDPAHLYEAAEVDGASAWQRFRGTSPSRCCGRRMLFGAVITGIGYLQFFEEVFVMTQGGPLNSTLSVAYYTYNQFSFGNYSYAAAMAYVLFVAIVR